MVEPLYRAEGQRVAYHLCYSWTAWPVGSRWRSLPIGELLDMVAPLWEHDGLRVLEHRVSPNELQVTFSTTPNVSPTALVRLAKGRLQRAMREADGAFEGFSRKVSVRSVGRNRTEDVRTYLARQVEKEHFADPAFEAMMRQFTVVGPNVDLAVPDASARGRYWYNLHLVLVVVERCRIVDSQRLGTIRDWCFKIAQKKGHRIALLSVMPDHLHVAMRANRDHSPQEIALAFQNNLAFAVGQTRIWNDGFYGGHLVNTICRPSDMTAIAGQPDSPSGRAGWGLSSLSRPT